MRFRKIPTQKFRVSDSVKHLAYLATESRANFTARMFVLYRTKEVVEDTMREPVHNTHWGVIDHFPE